MFSSIASTEYGTGVLVRKTREGSVCQQRTTYIMRGLLVLVIIGLFSSCVYLTTSSSPLASSNTISPQQLIESCSIIRELETLMDRVDKVNLTESLRFLTKEPHLTGTQRDYDIANYIKDHFISSGLDSAELVPYDTYISYANKTAPNEVALLDENGSIIFKANYQDKMIVPEDYSPEHVDAYLAYAAKGNVTGKLLFANYGRKEDFELLKQLGISINGTIVIAKYGKIFRGNKVKYAEKYGAIGVILYTDPDEYAQEGIEPENVYNNTWWLPGSGIQRGTTMTDTGDPLTPGWPSIEGAYRVKDEDTNLPKIPAQPIGYSDAAKLLSLLGGQLAPHTWAGALPGVDYAIGPGFKKPDEGNRVRLVVNNYRKVTRIYNVIGKIKGAVEPDRYVIYGNHYDAWGFGAADPSSGTAAFLEVVRIFGEMKLKGCRPRRTLLFGAWAAEEHGILGSTEWVEEHVPQLTFKATASVNIDTCVAGPEFYPRGSPFLWETIRVAMRQVIDPSNSTLSIYDNWLLHQPPAPEGLQPDLNLLSGVSDHRPFDTYLGIPTIKVAFITKNENPSNYPSYHTAYDTFNYFTKFLDPRSEYMEACAKFSVALLCELSDKPVIPINATDAGIKMFKTLHAMNQSGMADKLRNYGADLDILVMEVEKFVGASQLWHLQSAHFNQRSVLQTRMLSDQITSIQKAFVLHQGLPGRSQIRNAVFSPSLEDSYGASAFPGLFDLLAGIDDLPASEQKTRSQLLQKHISDLRILVSQATELLSLADLPTNTIVKSNLIDGNDMCDAQKSNDE